MDFKAEALKQMQEYISKFGMKLVLEALIDITKERNINNEPYLNSLQNGLEADLDEYESRYTSEETEYNKEEIE